MPSAVCSSLKRRERPVEDVQLFGEGRAEFGRLRDQRREAGPASMTTAMLARGDQQNDQNDRHQPGRNAAAFGDPTSGPRVRPTARAHSSGSSSARAR